MLTSCDQLHKVSSTSSVDSSFLEGYLRGSNKPIKRGSEYRSASERDRFAYAPDLWGSHAIGSDEHR